MNHFWKKKKVLVTGAAGFIGSHAVTSLIERGASVTAAISPHTDMERVHHMLGNNINSCSLVKADLLNFEDCIKITKGQNVILNFAAMDGGSVFKQKYPAQIFKVNTEIVLHMLESAILNKVERVLLMSSIEVYPKNVRTPIKEEYSLKENFQEEAHGYTWSKRFGEIAAKMYAKQYGLQIAIARAGNVYGPYDYMDVEKGRVIPTFIHQVLKGKEVTILGNGLQKRSFLYVEDLIKALLDLVEFYPVCDPVNIASKQYATIKDLASLIKSIVKGESIKMQKSTAKKDRLVAINKAESVIHFSEAMSLEEGLKKTIDYFREKS